MVRNLLLKLLKVDEHTASEYIRLRNEVGTLNNHLQMRRSELAQMTVNRDVWRNIADLYEQGQTKEASKLYARAAKGA